MGWECGVLSQENSEEERYLESHLIVEHMRWNTQNEFTYHGNEKAQ
jgi:hypothetical protein